MLVVDDDLGIQDLFRTFLKQSGFSRVVVGTAIEAIKSLRKQKNVGKEVGTETVLLT